MPAGRFSSTGYRSRRTAPIRGAEILVNLLRFAPLGMLLPWVLRVGSVRVGAVAGISSSVLSFTIELIQALTPLGTAGDVTDMLLNTIGCTLAASLVNALYAQLMGARSRRNRARGYVGDVT
jgi:glycopeptide antibiotics resistance protein